MGSRDLTNKYIVSCKFFHGGDINPFDHKDSRHAYWELEYTWITQVAGHPIEDEILSNFCITYPDLLDDISASVPTSFKAFFYDQYGHFGGSPSGFRDVLTAYVEK